MLLVKMGGSVITDKRVYRRFREDVMERIVKYLPKEDLIIVHGGGSFGHPLAKKYGITEGFSEEKTMGFAEIGRDMEDLNLRIIEILIENDIPAVSIAPHSFHIFGEEMDLHIFERFLSLGLVPVTYGDIILDSSQGINICSGDYLMLQLAREFRPEKVIFLTDVDGIYDRDPSEQGAELIEVLRRDSKVETIIKVDDVTGGVAYKISIMRKIARYSRVYVLNGFHPERIENVLNDEDFVGTVVE
ncbi:putative archaeal kinase [Aciduliprofundum sp. MAR08-339]|uniref:isopentenyl phosphate kinase n=1 Tax=Aciduliprofundum sp. (strain MAR08-339) TaxID=673860 RepID=UPI0002A4CB2F|nr:putative archaeal kinase [Aciduliprofundum sp. MAR08-339]